MLFLAAPQAEDFGQYLQVTFKLVDAAEWVEIYNKEKENAEAERSFTAGRSACGAQR